MSFWHKVKNFAQPYADEEYDEEMEDEEMEDFEEQEEQEAFKSRSRRTSPFASEEESAASASASAASAAAPERNAAPGFNGQILNMNSGKQEVVLFHAKSFDDAASAADELRKRKAVILNMENVDKALTRRVVDFLSGALYALDGSVKKIAQSTYLFCPHNMSVVGDLENLQAESESYI